MRLLMIACDSQLVKSSLPSLTPPPPSPPPPSDAARRPAGRTNSLLSAHLPPKVVQIVCCRLTPLQLALYTHYLESRAMG